MTRHRVTLLRRLARLRPGDFRDFARAQGAVLAAHWLVWRRPTGHLIAREPELVQLPPTSAPIPADVQRLLRAVNRASVYGLTRPRCLTRAVALLRLLEADGHRDGVLRIGVRWTDGAFIAHAWVEYQGAILDLDPALHRTFAPLAGARVASLDHLS